MSTVSLHPDVSLYLRPRRGALRLTRRGRLVVFVAALLAVVAMGLALMPGSSATQEAERTETVLVGTGDTLWEIAAGAAEPGETGAMVQHLIELNGLESGMLIAGQEIEVPVG